MATNAHGDLRRSNITVVRRVNAYRKEWKLSGIVDWKVPHVFLDA